jgi:hypothetical protein
LALAIPAICGPCPCPVGPQKQLKDNPGSAKISS